MKMHVLSGGRLRVRKTMYDANAVRGETMDVPVSCILLRHSQGNVLFDTGCHPTVAENAEAHWGGLAKVMMPVMRPGENVINALAGIGLQCDDIGVVVCSHLHPDHCGCNTFFKRATFVIQAKEVEAARAPGADNLHRAGLHAIERQHRVGDRQGNRAERAGRAGYDPACRRAVVGNQNAIKPNFEPILVIGAVAVQGKINRAGASGRRDAVASQPLSVGEGGNWRRSLCHGCQWA